MYSFQPLADYSSVHTGFYVVCGIVCVVMSLIIALWRDYEIGLPGVVIWTIISGTAVYVSHDCSYKPNHPLNEQHTGTLVGFNAEGYRERSGKQMVDVHYTYVIYRIDGNDVMFYASTGIAYPKQIVVYKN